jgi:hypothetical protein
MTLQFAFGPYCVYFVNLYLAPVFRRTFAVLLYQWDIRPPSSGVGARRRLETAYFGDCSFLPSCKLPVPHMIYDLSSLYTHTIY